MAKIVIPIAPDFEDSEFSIPYDRLKKAGHEILVVGETAGEEVDGKKGKETAHVDSTVEGLDVESFDALVIPGGHAPDKLRTNEDIVAFVKAFGRSEKLIAAVCHGPQLLIEADLVRGRTVTSWPSVRTDLENAGATWVDEEVVEDGNLITSRKPEDLDGFCRVIEQRLVGTD